jgi:hypothetical protein
MENAHPVILSYICKKHDIHHPELEFYIKNRKSILSKFDNPNVIKKEYLKMVNTNKSLSREFKDERMKAFDKEMGRIQTKLLEMEEYKPIRDLIPADKKLMNEEGSLINRVLCMYENKILQYAIKNMKSVYYINSGVKYNINLFALMFDGFMIELNCSEEQQKCLINFLNKKTEQKFPGLNLNWAVKSHDNKIIMPNEYDIPQPIIEVPIINTSNPILENFNEETRTFNESYEYIKKDFEKIHSKIIDRNFFIKRNDNDTFVIMKKTHLLTAYEHLHYKKPIIADGIVTGFKKVSFIPEWLKDETIKRYDDIGIYPNLTECPQNIYNMWIPFKMDKITEYTPDEFGKNFVLNHIKILCDNSEEVYEYFCKWITQTIKYPWLKSIMPVLIGAEGIGKGILMDLFIALFGRNKFYQSSNPSRDVWGNFNSRMKDCFFVNLDELSKKELTDSMGKVKDLITNPSLTINQKGIDPYDIISYHRFIVTTNSPDPIPTSKGDRRTLIIRCSDEKKGNSEYFNKLKEYIDDENVIKTLFEYFKNIELDKSFNFGANIPSTEYHSNLKEQNRSPIDLWLEDFARENIHKADDEMTGSDAYNKFNIFIDKCGIQYNTTRQKLGVILSNMKLPFIKKGKHTMKGDTKIYDLVMMREYYKIIVE